MDYLVALIISLLIGLAAGTLVRVRFRNTTFASVHRNITATIFILLFAFFLFTRFGMSLWAVILIPLISLLIIFLLIRNAISKLLELH